MCSPIRCDACNKITWAGCGAHVEDVMADVPRDQQCTCN